MTLNPRLALAQGRELLDAGDPEGAIALLSRITHQPDRDAVSQAWLLIGTARYRTDDEAGALAAWQQAAEAGGDHAWLGYRSVAEQHVRDGQLADAIEAYREADRRAPPAERGPIANRIAWLLKETGHDFASRRQFNRARGAYGSYAAIVTWGLIAINVAVFALDALTGGGGLGLFSSGEGGTPGACGTGSPVLSAGILCAAGVQQGEWWRLITSAFLHLGLLHIGFNMFALYLFGPIVEDLYGHAEYLVIYLLCALGGSVLTIIAAPGTAAAGASGAIFGLFGLGFVVWRRHHLVLNRQARAILSQMGSLLVLVLIITFTLPGISWTGHIGGLAVGAAIGFVVPPAGGATLAGIWRTPDGRSLQSAFPMPARALAYAIVLAVLVAGVLWAVNQGPSFGGFR